jgi:DUF1016 N-terminal domain
MDKGYVEFISDLKKNIVQSRYVAARLVNKEQLLLYFKTGRMLAEKIAAVEWGAKILEQIAGDLQKQLPGLRGFSARHLRSMKMFYDEYQSVIIWQSVTAEIRRVRREAFSLEHFWGISFK